MTGAIVTLTDIAATRRAAQALAGAVVGGDAIALCGDLGAGKTTFTAALVAALGGPAAQSPTFSLVNEYIGGRLIVWHVDLYRLEREAELAELGLDEVFGDRRGIVVVEWADTFEVMPRDHLRLDLSHPAQPGEVRQLRVAGTGPRGMALAAAMLASP